MQHWRYEPLARAFSFSVCTSVVARCVCAFHAWATMLQVLDNGGRLFGVECTVTPHAGRGLMATTALREGELLVAVPRCVWVTGECVLLLACDSLVL